MKSMMIRQAGAILAALWMGLPATAQTSEPQPVLVCEEKEYDFGAVDNLRVVEHAFTIHNAGTADLHVKFVDPKPSGATCKCQRQTLAETNVPPGAVESFSARFDLTGLKGAQRKEYVFESDDLVQPVVTVALQGLATEVLSLSPASLGDISLDACATGFAHLAFNSTNVFLPYRVTNESPYFTVRLVPPARENYYEVRVITRPPLPEGEIKDEIQVTTDYSWAPVVRVPVTATGVKPITATPPVLYLNASTQAVSREIFIRCRDGVLGVENIVSPRPSIGINVTGAGRNVYRLEVTNLVASSDLNDASIRVLTTRNVQPEIDIGIRVVQ